MAESIVTKIFRLDSDNKIGKWNRVVALIKRSQRVWFRNQTPARFKGISSAGLNVAEVTPKYFNDPHVVVLLSSDLELADLALLETMDKLMPVLYGFVPFSVYQNAYRHTLIVPMGLQKTPGGFGYKTEPPPEPPQSFDDDHSNLINWDTREYNPTANAVGGVFKRLFSEIKTAFPVHCALTRFATRDTFDSWDSRSESGVFHTGGIRATWNKQYKGTFRIGWRKFEHGELVETQESKRSQRAYIRKTRKVKDRYMSQFWEEKSRENPAHQAEWANLENAFDLQTERDRPKRVEIKLPPIKNQHLEGTPPEEYGIFDADKGGAAYEDDILTINDQDGITVFQLEQASKTPLKWILTSNLIDFYWGILICGWTKSTVHELRFGFADLCV